MRLLLIRHGQTPANVRGELDTAHPGPGLTDLGRRQAAAVPAALADHRIEALFASTLVRTQETIAPLAAALDLPVTILDGIHEIEAGDLEMGSDHASYRGYLGTAFAWGTGDRDAVMPGGTDGHAFFARYDASVAQVVATGLEVAALVSHGAAIRVWVAGACVNIEPSFAAEQDLENTALVIVEGSPEEGWTLVSWSGTPLGGAALLDETAEDPTGESIDDV